jgi:hypothetical protein
MKIKIPYGDIVTTKELQKLPDGILFSEHFSDGLAQEPPICKKLETLAPCDLWPDGDVLFEEMTFSQFAEVPGDAGRLGHKTEDGREWIIWDIEGVQKMVGWFMTSRQFLDC